MANANMRSQALKKKHNLKEVQDRKVLKNAINIMENENKKHKRNKNKNKAKGVDTTEQTSNHSDEDQNLKELEDTGEQHKDSDEESRKREHVEDSDSDIEDKPKKKKKKNKPDPEPTGEKKGKKSIRQMKREKHAQRQAEAQAASKDHLKTHCLSYLSQWKHDKQNWKFMKAKQVWLFKNKFSSTLVPDSSWPLLLEYFESAVGNIRKLLLEDANKIIKQKDEWLEAQNGKDKKSDEDEDEETPDGPKKPDETSYKRARDLIQCLQE